MLNFFTIEVESIITDNILREIHILHWDEYKNKILDNLSNINFNRAIEDDINYYKALHITKKRMNVTKKKMKEILYTSIILNNNIFANVGYPIYSIKEEYDIKQEDINDFIEVCIKILKQKLKK